MRNYERRSHYTHAHLTQQEAVSIFSALQRPGLLRTSFFIPASDASTLIRMINSAGAPQKCVRSVKKRSRSRNLGVNNVFAIIILVLVSESEPSDSLQYHPGPSTNHERSRYHGSCHPKRCPTAPIWVYLSCTVNNVFASEGTGHNGWIRASFWSLVSS